MIRPLRSRCERYRRRRRWLNLSRIIRGCLRLSCRLSLLRLPSGCALRLLREPGRWSIRWLRAEKSRRVGTMSKLNETDIQGFVLRGYNLPHARYVFLHFTNAAKARALIGRLLPLITTGQRWD